MSRVKNFKHANARLTYFQEQVCIGTLLGDSSLSKPKNGQNYHLACYHSEKQVDWLEQKWDWLTPHTRPIQLCEYTDKRNGKSYRGGRFHTISAPCFTKLADMFYKDGIKTITPDLMQKFEHPVALASLICDDGSWDAAGIAIASKQFTEDENYVLANGLHKAFDIDITVHTSERYPHIRIPSSSVEHTFALCSSYVPEFLYYKFGGSDYQTTLTGKVGKICPVCHKTFSSYASVKQVYCSRACASIGRPSGYETRHTIKICPQCGIEFLIYNKRQVLCSDCAWKTRKH